MEVADSSLNQVLVKLSLEPPRLLASVATCPVGDFKVITRSESYVWKMFTPISRSVILKSLETEIVEVTVFKSKMDLAVLLVATSVVVDVREKAALY